VPLTIHPQCPRRPTAEACHQNCEVRVSIKKKANKALVGVRGVVKCGAANLPSGVNAKQM